MIRRYRPQPLARHHCRGAAAAVAEPPAVARCAQIVAPASAPVRALLFQHRLAKNQPWDSVEAALATVGRPRQHRPRQC